MYVAASERAAAALARDPKWVRETETPVTDGPAPINPAPIDPADPAKTRAPR